VSQAKNTKTTITLWERKGNKKQKQLLSMVPQQKQKQQSTYLYKQWNEEKEKQKLACGKRETAIWCKPASCQSNKQNILPKQKRNYKQQSTNPKEKINLCTATQWKPEKRINPVQKKNKKITTRAKSLTPARWWSKKNNNLSV